MARVETLTNRTIAQRLREVKDEEALWGGISWETQQLVKRIVETTAAEEMAACLGTGPAFSDARGSIQNRVVSGNVAVGEVVWTGTNNGSLNGMPPTNKAVRVQAAVVITEEGGKIAKARHYIDVAGNPLTRARWWASSSARTVRDR